MHLRKYDGDYTRRQCLESLGKGTIGAGILMPLFDAWANSGDIRAAYPDEALQIETYSKGAVKAGGMLDAGNVDSVKDLLDPATYAEIKDQGRVARIRPTTTDVNKLSPRPYVAATAKNAGVARFDAKGNVVTADGKPWIGGNPFPNATEPQQICAAHAVSWGRHDQYAVPTHVEIVDANGDLQYTYEFYWVDCAAVARTFAPPEPYMPGHEDKLRFVTFLSTYPSDSAGAVALNIWPYDQTQFPQVYAYVPSYKRIRRAPGNQRFEPMLSGSSMAPSDMWMIGDPYLTWGNFKLVGKTPFLGHVSGNWNASDPNWMAERVGGRSGRKFFLTTMELIPECFIVDIEPVHYAQAPVSRKRLWFDARTMMPMSMIVYDKDDRPWKVYTCSFDEYARDGQMISERHPQHSDVPYWSWCGNWMHDLKTGQVSLGTQVKQVAGGYGLRLNDPGMFEQFCTVSALQNLGA